MIKKIIENGYGSLSLNALSVYLSVRKGNATIREISEDTGIAKKLVESALMSLLKNYLIESTGKSFGLNNYSILSDILIARAGARAGARVRELKG